jgi:hypothetical protein
MLAVVSAGAAGTQSVRCVGGADSCSATVSIAGGASNRAVTVNLSGTNLKLAGVWAIPAASRKAFGISNASYRLGGSQYRFTLNAVKSNPRRARIILVFVSQGAAAVSGRVGVGGQTVTASAFLSVGSGMTVSIVGGGGGTSNCTTNETNDTFTTAGANERHDFSFLTRASGSCAFEPSWSQFKLTVKDSGGTVVGRAVLSISGPWPSSDYSASCTDTTGLTCKKTGKFSLTVTRP